MFASRVAFTGDFGRCLPTVRLPQGECTGVLAIRRPWPSMLRTVAGDHERFQEVYFNVYKGMYFSGDGCKRDKVRPASVFCFRPLAPRCCRSMSSGSIS